MDDLCFVCKEKGPRFLVHTFNICGEKCRETLWDIATDDVRELITNKGKFSFEQLFGLVSRLDYVYTSETFFSIFELHGELGHGAYGYVYLAKFRDSNEYFALKYYSAEMPLKAIEKDFQALEQLTDFPQELLTNIVKPHFLIKIAFDGNTIHYALGMDYIKGISLFDSEELHPYPLVNLNEIRNWIAMYKRAVLVIANLHQRNISHGDLATRNMMLRDNVLDEYGNNLVILDFGLGCSDGECNTFSGLVQSISSPEVYFTNAILQNNGDEAAMAFLQSRIRNGSFKLMRYTEDYYQLANSMYEFLFRKYTPWSQLMMMFGHRNHTEMEFFVFQAKMIEDVQTSLLYLTWDGKQILAEFFKRVLALDPDDRVYGQDLIFYLEYLEVALLTNLTSSEPPEPLPLALQKDAKVSTTEDYWNFVHQPRQAQPYQNSVVEKVFGLNVE